LITLLKREDDGIFNNDWRLNLSFHVIEI